MKGSPTVHLRKALEASLAAIGVPTEGIETGATIIRIPSDQVSIELVATKDGRVWRASETYFVRPLGAMEERPVTTVLFETPLGNEILMARWIARRIAEARIDFALDGISMV